MILSRGESNTRWSASVSSTAPRLGARCPARRATGWMMTWRISAARRLSSARERDLRSAGEWMFSSIIPSLRDPGPDQGAGHAEQRADQNFERRVSKQLHQALGARF